MAAYLTKLWDRMALKVLANTRDMDARDSDYDRKVSAVVWQTVRKLREGRKVFRLEVGLDAKKRREERERAAKAKR